MPGELIVCASPIGNLADAPPRLAEALGSVDLVFAEDTRRARVLLDHLGVTASVRSFYVGNEHQRAEELRDHLAAGGTAALLSDAGSPSVADPGLMAIRAAIEADAHVTGVPGPSAVTLALAVSGAPADRFVFEGFLPRKGQARAARIDQVMTDDRTVVIFCAPTRLRSDLAALAEHDPDRRCVVARELTKLHEEVWRGALGDAAEHWSDRPVKGEVTLVVWGSDPVEPDLAGAIEDVLRAVESGSRRSEAVRGVAKATGVSRRLLYEAINDRLPGDDAARLDEGG